MTRGGGGQGGKDEPGKVMGPLFPRLHVSDAGKGGGPRAPPRNKMALYEQFTVPSNRFSSPAASARAAGGSLVPSTAAAQVSSSMFASAFFPGVVQAANIRATPSPRD
jgi:protein EARLY FLOWERING 3